MESKKKPKSTRQIGQRDYPPEIENLWKNFKMASIEEVRQELNDAKVQLRKAENEKNEFKEGDWQWLEELKEKQRRREKLEEKKQ